VHRHFFKAFGRALFKRSMAMERAEGRTTFVGVIKLDSSTRGWYTKSSSGSSEQLKTLRFGESCETPSLSASQVEFAKEFFLAGRLPTTQNACRVGAAAA
jgi:hypothetical protein